MRSRRDKNPSGGAAGPAAKRARLACGSEVGADAHSFHPTEVGCFYLDGQSPSLGSVGGKLGGVAVFGETGLT